MKISDGERLIGVMLAEVMESLNLNHEIDPSLVKKLLVDKADWAIGRKYHWLENPDTVSDGDVKETVDILWMWGIIEYSIDQLQGADAAEAATWHWKKFDGFDGNNDDHHGIARTLIDDLDDFSEFKGRNLNSHSRGSLPRYRDMYVKFNGYLNSGQSSPFPVNVLRDLCS